MAPEGCSSLFVLEPIPNLDGRSTGKPRPRRCATGYTPSSAQAGYPDDMVTEELVTPLDWRDQGMAAGTPFALAHTFPQTGPFRPPNVERRLPGLIFAGSGTVPAWAYRWC